MYNAKVTILRAKYCDFSAGVPARTETSIFVVFKTANKPPLDVQSIYNLVHTNGNDHHNRRLSAGYRYDIALTKLAGEKVTL